MFWAAYSVHRVVGGDLLLIVWGICTMVYLACGLLRSWKRGKRVWRKLIAGLLASEALTDAICFPIFFPEGEYHNWGIGSVYMIALWPGLMLIAYALTVAFGTKAA